MKNLFFLFCFIIGCLVVGCSKDEDNGVNGNGDGDLVIPRLVANTTAPAPSTTDANDGVWDTIDSTIVQIGFSETYGQNPRMKKDTVLMKVILKSDMLYIWARWADATKSVWGNHSIKSFNLGFWERINTVELGGGEDAFMIIFDAGDNGEEGADCSSMCHVLPNRMATTGGGHVDAWCWKSARLAPANLAEDHWWADGGNFLDPIPGSNKQYAYEENWFRPFNQPGEPKWMHIDDTAFAGPYLFKEDAITFERYNIGWDSAGGYKMPGHRIDASIYSSATRNDMYDVLAASVFDETSSPKTWTVVFSRTLAPSSSNDIDFQALDSIEVSVAASQNHADGDDLNWVEHSGSVPFYIIFNPPTQ